MRCEIRKQMISDLLDKTLSAQEEWNVKSHLAGCESCQSEFQKLKRADAILRKVVCEVVSEIEVPSDLNHRIEKILAVEQRKKSLAGQLRILLKNPAVAAVLLFTLITASILNFHNPFYSKVKQSEIVLSEPQSGNITDSSSPTIIQKETQAADKPAPEKNETYFTEERAVAGGTSKEPEEELKEQPSKEVEEKLEQPAFSTAAQAPQPSVKPLPQEKRSLAPESGATLKIGALEEISNNSGSSTSDGATFRKGTLDEAAKEVGFNPAKPAYLPQGSELRDVLWFSGTVYQNYRAGQSFFTISQSRADMIRFNYDEEMQQGETIEINGTRAILQETKPVAGDNVSWKYTTVRWQQGEWIFSVSSELSRDEIIKIAISVK